MTVFTIKMYELYIDLDLDLLCYRVIFLEEMKLNSEDIEADLALTEGFVMYYLSSAQALRLFNS